VSETVVLSVLVGEVAFENSEGMGDAPESVMASDVLVTVAALSIRTWDTPLGFSLMVRRTSYSRVWAKEE